MSSVGGKFLASLDLDYYDPPREEQEESEVEAATAPLIEVAAGHMSGAELASWLSKWRAYGERD